MTKSLIFTFIVSAVFTLDTLNDYSLRLAEMEETAIDSSSSFSSATTLSLSLIEDLNPLELAANPEEGRDSWGIFQVFCLSCYLAEDMFLIWRCCCCCLVIVAVVDCELKSSELDIFIS